MLGKEVKYVVADSEAKPNTAVQEQSRFITENKVIVMIGSTSSAVAVAMNKLAEREKVIYLTGIPARMTQPARIVSATPSGRISTAKPRQPRSARSW